MHFAPEVNEKTDKAQTLGEKMQLNNKPLSLEATFLRRFIWIMFLLGFSPMHSFARQPQVIDCGNFADYLVLNSHSVDSRVLKKVDVSSPLLNAAAIEAVVKVRIFVGRDGRVVCARAIGSGNPVLQSLAEQAAMKWRFRPYIHNGHKSPFKGNISFHIHR